MNDIIAIENSTACWKAIVINDFNRGRLIITKYVTPGSPGHNAQRLLCKQQCRESLKTNAKTMRRNALLAHIRPHT